MITPLDPAAGGNPFGLRSGLKLHRAKLRISLSQNGPSGSLFSLIKKCVSQLERANWPESEIAGFYRDVAAAPTYDEACSKIERYFIVNWF